MNSNKTPGPYALPNDGQRARYESAYESGPFQGRPIAHPFNTVLNRLNAMGVTAPDKQFDESDEEYIVRLDRTYTGLFSDIISSGILGGGGA